MFDNWHRIEKVVKWTGLSVNAFAREIGLNRSENLYQIKRGNNRISRELAETICSKYPLISKGWLLTGEGEMFVGADTKRGDSIPFYNVDVVKFVASGCKGKADYDLQLPFMPKCDFGAKIFGRSLSPHMPAGAVVLCDKSAPETIMLGMEYVIVSRYFTGIGRVKNNPRDGKLLFTPINMDIIEELEITVEDISQIYSIKGVIIDKSN